MKKWVYFFGAGKAEGDGEWRDLLGGKGAGLAEMTKIGLPVPAGFTISTEACDYFYKNGKKYPGEAEEAGGGQRRTSWKRSPRRSWAIRRTRCWSACVPARRAPCRG